MRREPLGTPLEPEARSRLPAHKRPSAEAGFTLVEMLLAVSLALLLAAAVMSFMITSLRSANAASSRTVAAREAEVFLARLSRDVRQAQHIEVFNSITNKYENKTPVNVTYTPAGTSVSFFLPNPGSSAVGTEVRWSCSLAPVMTCTRAVAGGTTVTELTRVESATFTPYSAAGLKLASGAGASAIGEYPSSIQLALAVQDTSQLDSEHTHLVTGVTNPITVGDGVSLRNYAS